MTMDYIILEYKCLGQRVTGDYVPRIMSIHVRGTTGQAVDLLCHACGSIWKQFFHVISHK